MEGSGWTRVEYRLSALTLPLCFLRNWRSGVSKKMRSLINTNRQHSDTRWLLHESRRTSDVQIERQTESLKDETDLKFKGLLRKMRQKFDVCTLLYKSAKANAGDALSENQKSSRIANSDLYWLLTRTVCSPVNALISIFRPRTSNYSAALNAAQR
jgi:hypothetical protein